MKRTSLFIVFFMVFSAMKGYGAGKKEFSELTKKVVDIEVGLKTIQNNRALEDRIKKLEDERSQRNNPPSPVHQQEPVPYDEPQPKPINRPSMDEPQSIPIDWAIVVEQKENLGELNYYVSKDISLTIPGSVKTNTKVQDGILEEIKDERSEEKLEISKDDLGKMLKFSAAPTDRESLEIFFSAKSANLTFTRNKNKNVFELTSVRKDGKEIDFKGEAVQLYIKYKGGPRSDTTGKTAVDSRQQRAPSPPAARRDRPPAIPQNILLERGQGYLTQDAVVDFMQKHSRSPWFSRSDMSTLVKSYFEIAKEEQVNHEIAIAQMWYATRELSHDALLRNYNYAGLEEVERGTFNDRETGVRAHIQHLKGYASTVIPKNVVDPRYNILVANGYLGKGSTFEKLSAFWSANKEYEANIIRILRGMYQYQYDSQNEYSGYDRYRGF
jgi:hypothetical protein